MGTDAAVTEAHLRTCKDSMDLVQITRRWSADDPIEGYVGAVGQKWAAIAVLDDKMVLDGFACIRLRDVTEVRVRGGMDGFATRSLILQGAWPPPPPELDLRGRRRILASAARNHRIVSLFQERRDPDVCFIGRLAAFDRDSVSLVEITPDAIWRKEPSRWPLDTITRIDAGGLYERRLLDVADDRLRTSGNPPQPA